MSPISRDDLHRIFKNLDKNNEGLVSIDELHRLLVGIGIHTTAEELEKLVGRTSLDYVDFLCFYDTLVVKAGATEQEDDHHYSDLISAFKVFDSNGDGFITSEELQSALSRMGLWERHSGHDCKHIIDVYDENSDGALDFEEFKNMMTSVPPAAGSETW